MNRSVRKDFFVEIKKSLNRYLSILFIVALGVAFFSGVRSAQPDMRLSADYVADKSNFMDFRVLSTLGLTEEDLEVVRSVEGVTAAEGVYSADVLCPIQDKEPVLHVESMPEELNRVHLLEGRLPEKSGECFLDSLLTRTLDVKVGDTLTLQSGTKDPLSDKLFCSTYTVTGIGSSPYYLNLDRGSSSIGDGDVRGFLLVPKEDFALEVYTQIYVKAAGLDPYLTAGEEYQEAADQVAKRIEDISGGRCTARLDGIRADAQEEIDEKKTELADAQQELTDAAAEIAENETELADAQAEIDTKTKELEDGEAELAEKEPMLAEAEAALADKKTAAADAQAQLNTQAATLQTSADTLAAKRTELENAQVTLTEQAAQLEAGKQAYADGVAAVGAARQELEENKQALADAWSQYEALAAAGETPPEVLEAMRQELEGKQQALGEAEAMIAEEEQGLAETGQALAESEQTLAAAQQQVTDGLAAVANGETELENGRAALKAAQTQLDDGVAQIAAGEEELGRNRRELNDAKQELADGRAALEDARQELADGMEKLADAKAEFEEKKADADQEIADGWEKIAEAEQELADLSLPKWYVLDRTMVPSYAEFDQDAERMGAIGDVFPVIFFLVAALVSLTTMTRMVEEKRTEIGTFKALGYSTAAIASKYILYALSATLIGSVIGFLIGEKILPWVIIHSYRILYVDLYQVLIPYRWTTAFWATLIAVCCTVGATLAACYKTAMAQPAQLMRPAAPVMGKKILLERVGPIWRRLNFSRKSTLRNLFRYKKRLIMTVFGIGACMALILVGFGIRDSIYVVSDRQYGAVWKYDAVAMLQEDESEAEKEALRKDLTENSMIREVLNCYVTSMDAQNGKGKKTINLVVPEDLEAFPDFFTMQDRITHEKYKLDDSGVIISEKLARELDLKEGDLFSLKEDETTETPVRVSHITENYLYHYIYMAPELYRERFGKAAEPHTCFLILEKNGTQQEQELAQWLLEEPAVAGVSGVTSLRQTILDMLRALDMVVWVLIVSAGLLAFVVLYNLNNINITERKRELATLRLLGFYDMELAVYVYRENVLLTLIGILVGVFMGKYLHLFVIKTVEVDLIMFGRNMEPLSYLVAGLITLLFAAFVNAAMYFKLKKIDMVESLKSVE